MDKKKIFTAFSVSLLAAAFVCGCGPKSDIESSDDGDPSGYSGMSDIGENVINANISESVEANNTTYVLNGVIDSGRVKDGLKYLYLDVTVKNDSDKDYPMSGLNNFYLILPDASELYPDVRAEIYARQSLSGYEESNTVPAGGELHTYIGFTPEEEIDSFTACFFPTADSNDKTSVIKCPVGPYDIKPAPAEMFGDTEKSS